MVKIGLKINFYFPGLTPLCLKKTIDAGGSEKQPNSCNACHYHKNDTPEDMLNVLEKVKTSGKDRKTFD